VITVHALAQRLLLGPEGMTGALGLARTDIAPEGLVETRGSLGRGSPSSETKASPRPPYLVRLPNESYGVRDPCLTGL
jgi:hypothetical protein